MVIRMIKHSLLSHRHSDLKGFQIINYRSDSTQKWLCLVGISQKDGRIVGKMQLYSVQKNKSQSIDGHAAAFADYTVAGSNFPSTLLATAVRTATAARACHFVFEFEYLSNPLQLLILEVAKEGGATLSQRSCDIFFTPEAAADFPVAMQISEKIEVFESAEWRAPLCSLIKYRLFT
jgi:clathrin heavy chain